MGGDPGSGISFYFFEFKSEKMMNANCIKKNTIFFILSMKKFLDFWGKS
jgi:hypothetical protein